MSDSSLKINPLTCDLNSNFKANRGLITCLAPKRDFFNALMHKDFLPTDMIQCQNLYRIIQLRATGSDENSDYILKDWNGSGVNINAVINDVHLTFLIKDTVPFKDAVDKVTKTLEMDLERTSPTSGRRSNDSNELAHQSTFVSAPLTNPSEPQIMVRYDVFPEALVINEVNNDPYFTYVLFKAFHENYTIGEYEGIDFVRSMPVVKLTYFVPCEIRVKPRTYFYDVSNELIYLVSSINSDPANILSCIQNSDTRETLVNCKKECIKVRKNGKVCKQIALSNRPLVVKNPDVMVFTDAFLEELPSYTETTLQNTIQRASQNATSLEKFRRRLRLRLQCFKNGLKWKN